MNSRRTNRTDFARIAIACSRVVQGGSGSKDRYRYVDIDANSLGWMVGDAGIEPATPPV